MTYGHDREMMDTEENGDSATQCELNDQWEILLTSFIASHECSMFVETRTQCHCRAIPNDLETQTSYEHVSCLMKIFFLQYEILSLIHQLQMLWDDSPTPTPTPKKSFSHPSRCRARGAAMKRFRV